MLKILNNKLILLLPLILLILTSPSYALTPLNSMNGLNPFYILTTATFYPPVLLLIILTGYFRVGLITKLLSILVLYTLSSTLPNLPELVNYSKINIGLFNPIGQYHPPLLFLVLIGGMGWLKSPPPGKNIRVKYILIKNLTITIVLSCWWANQELFWGNYWNWDPVELSSLLVFFGFLMPIHNKKYTKNGYTGWQVPYLPLLIITIAYISNRGPTANSVHKFNETFFLKIDGIWFWFFWFLLAKLVTTIVNKKLYFSRNYKWNIKLVRVYCTSAVLILISLWHITGSALELYEPKLVSKYCIAMVLIYIYILKNKLRVGVPQTTPHIIPILVACLILLYSEPPTHQLFLDKACESVHILRPSNNFLLISHNDGSVIHLAKTGQYKLSIKNQTIIFRSTNTTVTPQRFSKLNSNNPFILFDINNITKIISLSAYRLFK